jgi:hypothetical protein
VAGHCETSFHRLGESPDGKEKWSSRPKIRQWTIGSFEDGAAAPCKTTGIADLLGNSAHFSPKWVFKGYGLTFCLHKGVFFAAL